MAKEKQAAILFLRALEQHLNNYLPGAAEMVRRIPEIVRRARPSGLASLTGFPEGAFLNGTPGILGVRTLAPNWGTPPALGTAMSLVAAFQPLAVTGTLDYPALDAALSSAARR